MSQKEVFLARLTSNNQVTVPKPILQRLALHAGNQVAFTILGSRKVSFKRYIETDDFWKLIADQFEKSGRLDDDEIDWGEDIEFDTMEEFF